MNAHAACTTARGEAQRERILCAAQKCFIEHGFHAASMASIAEAARMSAGLMYRYFENKNAIVLAIIERQLKEGRAQIARLHSSRDLADGVLAAFGQWRARDPAVMNAALFLEMSAEATRDPQIAGALACSQERLRGDLEAWMCRGREDGGLGLTADLAESRAVLLQCVIDGLAVRAACMPATGDETLQRAVADLVERLLSS